MRIVIIGLFGALIAACQPGLLRPETEGDRQATDTADQTGTESGDGSHINGWLLERQALCSLTANDQRRRLEALARSPSDSFAALQRVFLASCRPESTPGLLRDALNSLDIKPSWTPAQHALLAMMRDHVRSYGVLEERIAGLSRELENTIDGIREIETDMEKINLNNGVRP